MSLFDSYRTPDDRKLMAEFVLRTRFNWDTRMETIQIVIEELRGLNHIGLATLYRDAVGAQGSKHKADYDPSAEMFKRQ